MSALGTQMSTATVNGHPVSFVQANDPDPAQPAVAVVTVTVTLAFDDLVAALYVWNDDDNAMADPSWARLLVTEAVSNMGLVDLGEVKAEMAGARPGTCAADWLAYCQRRARGLLAQPARCELIGAGPAASGEGGSPVSALDTGASHLTTAQLNDHRVAVGLAHRPAETRPGLDDGSVLVTVAAPVGLTLDDVAAVLFDWMNTGGTFGDLNDDETVRAFVAEYVINEGCVGVEEAQVAATAAGDAPVLEYCRQRVATVFNVPEATNTPRDTLGSCPTWCDPSPGDDRIALSLTQLIDADVPAGHPASAPHVEVLRVVTDVPGMER